MEHGMNCPHHADKDEACTCALTERTMHAAWRKRAEEAETRIAALEAQVKSLTADRDAQAEAVRVLAAECEMSRVCVEPDPIYGWDEAPPPCRSLHGLARTRQDAKQTDANPIAAAVEEGMTGAGNDRVMSKHPARLNDRGGGCYRVCKPISRSRPCLLSRASM